MTIFRTTLLCIFSFSIHATTTCDISHIALNDGWGTQLIVENAGVEVSEVNLTVYTDSISSTSSFVVPSGSSVYHRIETGQCGQVSYSGENVIAKIAYVHAPEKGVAEFILTPLSEGVQQHEALHFLFPQYLASQLTWMGFALMNPSADAVDVTLEAFDRDGGLLSEVSVSVEGLSRLVGLVDTVFEDIDFHNVARVRAQASTNLSGITISGNTNAQLLFTQAQRRRSAAQTLVLAHHATQSDVWNNVLVFDNVGDAEASYQLDLYANGVKVAEEMDTIEANSSQVFDLSAYGDLEIDSGLLFQVTPSLFVRMSHVCRQTNGTAEFLLSSGTSNELAFHFPDYAADQISWKGLALFNVSAEDTFLILKGFRDGEEAVRTLVHLAAHSKFVRTVSDLFPNVEGINRIMAIANTPLAGLNIAGEELLRLLFTAAVPYQENRSFLERLEALPGVEITQIETLQDFERCYRVDVTQPLNHDTPDGDTFTQTIWLSHRSETQPMVLSTGGYMLSSNRTREVTELLHANQIITPHRFFDGARPDNPDWHFMNIDQASRDLHRITGLFKELYRGKWVNTGGSKGGMTSMFHRRFFPFDVDVTVAYVAPIILDLPDERFERFMQEEAGTEPCRERLRQMQRRMLEYRIPMIDSLQDIAPDYGRSYNRLGYDVAFEYMVMEYPVAFWQYGANDCSAMPPENASVGDMITHLLNTVGFLYCDGDLDAFDPFYYQAVTEFGYYSFMTDPFADLLVAAPNPTWTTFVPPAAPPTVYQPEVMQDILAWLQSEGNQMIYIYGGNDPWTSCAVELTGQTDAVSVTEPGQNHGVRIYECAESHLIYAALEAWLGLPISPNIQKLKRTVSFDHGIQPIGIAHD